MKKILLATVFLSSQGSAAKDLFLRFDVSETGKKNITFLAKNSPFEGLLKEKYHTTLAWVQNVQDEDYDHLLKDLNKTAKTQLEDNTLDVNFQANLSKVDLEGNYSIVFRLENKGQITHMNQSLNKTLDTYNEKKSTNYKMNKTFLVKNFNPLVTIVDSRIAVENFYGNILKSIDLTNDQITKKVLDNPNLAILPLKFSV